MSQPVLMVIAVAHSTPSEEEQVALFKAQRFGIGTRVRGRAIPTMDARARIDMALLDTIAERGGLAVITFDIGRMRQLALVPGNQVPKETPTGLRSLQVARWIDLPADLREINSMGNAICEITGEAATLVRQVAAKAGLEP